MPGVRPRPGRPFLAGAPHLVAHRGGSGLAPENTLEAFRSAVDDWGADILEMDVRLTADGHVVVIHDETVDRTTDGSGAVRDLTLAEIRSLDAGWRFTDPSGDPSFRGRGVRVPTFDEILDAFPAVRINVEAKEGPVARPLVETIVGRGAQHRVLVAAEQERNRRDLVDYPGPLGASRRDCLRFLLLHRVPFLGGFTPRIDAFQVPEHHRGLRVVTPRLVTEAHRRNIPVHVWTVDDADDMRRLLSWGVDGIHTDRPDVLSEVLVAETGRPEAPCRRAGRNGAPS